MTLFDQLAIPLPIVQAPMAGTSTPRMAAAVCNAGALGSIAFGATDAAGAAKAVGELRGLTDRPFNANLFVHATAAPDAAREADWIAALTPLFERYDATPPTGLRPIYRSFAEDDAMLAMLVEARPAVVSFHFGLPAADRIAALKQAGCVLLSTATSLTEAHAARAAGIDAVVAQGWEAGGHRGMFDPAHPDDRLGVFALTRLLVREAGLPVIAAGGIMDGAGIAAALRLGAVGAQLGTAFVACPESSADEGHRAALLSDAAGHTVMTDAISGRPARCLPNRFTTWGEAHADLPRPGYPMVYDAGKALIAAAKAKGEWGYGAQWAGQGAPLARVLPAGELVAVLAREMAAG
ncbi:nitronate monooxygenase [Sphingobium sufflavum]|uniref:NAD(P)H-dependent flavin oxidoreductase n=1 Tax=Sphingobium sufflavum TaxID=1129547 RepID=UPI001F3EACE1|nr:nitronate monooxygenase [Sphingobium sufflavum]MCE7798578.1 nitronate monooxygenase [Sphingobium sufflavum]